MGNFTSGGTAGMYSGEHEAGKARKVQIPGIHRNGNGFWLSVGHGVVELHNNCIRYGIWVAHGKCLWSYHSNQLKK